MGGRGWESRGGLPASAQNLTQINVAPASNCLPVIATAFVAIRPALFIVQPPKT